VSRDQPGPQAHNFLFFVGAMLLIGAIGGIVLASSVHGQKLDTGFWSQIITVTGVSALPLVAIAIRAPASALARWRTSSAIAVGVSFVLVLAIVGVCLDEIAPYIGKDAEPSTPSDGHVYFACTGMGVVLAAVASGVVADFFKDRGGFDDVSPGAELTASDVAKIRNLVTQLSTSGDTERR